MLSPSLRLLLLPRVSASVYNLNVDFDCGAKWLCFCCLIGFFYSVTSMLSFSFCFQENIFEWQFAIRGPSDSEFEGGIYHGRIQLPAEYPFKPPSFMLLTVRISFHLKIDLASCHLNLKISLICSVLLESIIFVSTPSNL